MIVVDTNILAYLLIPGTHTDKAKMAYRKDPEWAVPILWRSEFRNVLSQYLHHNLMSIAEAWRIMAEGETTLQDREYDVSSNRVLTLAAESLCTAYDCEFVALAEKLGVPLVTHDSKVRKAFPSIAKSLIEFIGN